MLDYHALMARAVTRLDRNTAEDRRELFDRARALLVKRLDNRNPAATMREIKREQLALEEAIRQIELELATAAVHSSATELLGDERLQRFGENGFASGSIVPSVDESEFDYVMPGDPSTFIHITTQLWLDHLVADARAPTAPDAMKSDLKTVLQWLEVKKPEDIGSQQHEQWALGFGQYLMEGKAPCPELSRSFNFFREQVQAIELPPARLRKPITDDMRVVFDQMLAFDEDISLPRPEKKPAPVAPPPSLSKFIASIKASQKASQPVADPAPERAAPAIKMPAIGASLVKGVLGFIVGFVLVLCFEALLFARSEILSGHLLRTLGLGWFVMPIAAGFTGWFVLRNVETAKAGLKHLFVDVSAWRREHQIALAIMFAVGWIVGVVLGFLLSAVGTPSNYLPTFGTWLLGSPQYFPFASLVSGFVGGLVGAAIIYVRRLLRLGETSVGDSDGDEVAAEITRAKADTGKPAEATPVPRSSPHRGFKPPVGKSQSTNI